MNRGQVEIRDRSPGAMLLQLLAFSCLVGLAHGREDTDPEVNMNVPQIIQRWGYPAEIHEVTTKDGYILQMHRVPYGKGQSSGGKRPVAFLQHGLLASSSSWVTNLPEFSLAYIMADQGFDVWLGNSRGNDYANKSVSMDENSHEFWKFSFDEMQKHDLDASIDYALKQSGQKYVYYVGHSQGTKIMFAKLSEDSKFATKIRQFHALAPIGQIGNIKGFLKWMATKFYYESELMLDILGRDKFLPDNPVFNSLLKQYCYQELIDYACEDALFAICGPNSHQTNVTRLPVFLVDEPSGTSGKNMHHWIQIVKSGKDQMYNYDIPGENELHYGKKDAPLYDVSKIKTDTYLYWSPSDWLGDEIDVTNYLLAKYNPMYLKGNYKLMDFEHLDFIWGNRAAAEIYTPMIATMKKDIV